MSDRRPTLLVFTLGAAGDRDRRPLLPGRLRDAEIGVRRAWVAAALAAGRGAGCRLAVSSPRPWTPGTPATAVAPGEAAGASGADEKVAHLPQRGGGFGERLARALDDAFAAGDGPVVVVGGDAPGLTAAHVRQALERLAGDPDRVVAGPCPDGGFYLLAAARPIPGLAAGVRWCRGDALASLRRALAAAGRELVSIAPLADLDRPADFERWLAGGARRRGSADRPSDWRRLISLLLGLLALLRRPAVPPRLGRPRPALAGLHPGRGPPLLGVR
jgi:2-phospho-L-lactate guanylyltransferase (CobY/MobA/RfbA family)